MAALSRIILGSRSPRRKELLELLIPADCISIVPPRDSAEAGFDGLDCWQTIEPHLQSIARTKCDDVLGQLQNSQTEFDVVITADTVIVAVDSDQDDKLIVLGQPPENDNWQETVRRWFQNYYFGKTHFAVTAACVADSAGQIVERLVKSEVTFRADGQRWLDWYLQTDEPQGKAGGYAIQQAGSIFVEKVEGSLSNIVGLPVEELIEVLDQLNFELGKSSG